MIDKKERKINYGNIYLQDLEQQQPRQHLHRDNQKRGKMRRRIWPRGRRGGSTSGAQKRHRNFPRRVEPRKTRLYPRNNLIQDRPAFIGRFSFAYIPAYRQRRKRHTGHSRPSQKYICGGFSMRILSQALSGSLSGFYFALMFYHPAIKSRLQAFWRHDRNTAAIFQQLRPGMRQSGG